MDTQLDRVIIRDLLVRGIIGVNPDERKNRQDILINITMWTDTRLAAASDNIAEAVDYSTVAKAVVHHIESGQPLLVERLAESIARLCCEMDARVQAVEVSVEKTRALRFGRSVGVIIYRRRQDLLTDG